MHAKINLNQATVINPHKMYQVIAQIKKLVQRKTQQLEKQAIIYLPYGYNEEENYNIFYLMHGGWSNETTTLGTPDNPSGMKNVIDHAIVAEDWIEDAISFWEKQF